jgi:hypothetical protein
MEETIKVGEVAEPTPTETTESTEEVATEETTTEEGA